MAFMKPFHYYKHKRCVDMAIAVLKVQFRGPTYTRLKVRYVRPRDKMEYAGGSDSVVIENSDLNNWEYLGPC